MPYPYYPNYPTYPTYQPNAQQTMPYYPQYPMAQGPAQQPAMPNQNVQPAQTAPIQPPIQNGGFVPVRSEEEARNWPVAPGNSVTFIDENAAYVYTKTATYNQLDRPQFVKYRLEREEDPQIGATGTQTASNAPDGKSIDYAEKADLTALAGVVRGMNDMVGAMQKDIETMKSDMYGVVGQKKTATAKKETAKKEENEDA